jgi:hypothetical protein
MILRGNLPNLWEIFTVHKKFGPTYATKWISETCTMNFFPKINGGGACEAR